MREIEITRTASKGFGEMCEPSIAFRLLRFYALRIANARIEMSALELMNQITNSFLISFCPFYDRPKKRSADAEPASRGDETKQREENF